MKFILVLLFFFPGALRAESKRTNSKRAKPSVVHSCSKCHGQNGVSKNPLIPNLKGQKRDYLISSLKDYKKGQRQSQIMTPIAKTLSLRTIKALAKYYSSLK